MRKGSIIPSFGAIFPPRGPMEVAAYDLDDVFQGYHEHAAGEDLPGDNHSAGYRWSAMNRRRDRSGLPDGFDHIRRAYAAVQRGGGVHS